MKKVVKPTKPPHYGNIRNNMTFAEAYDFVLNNPNKVFETTGNKSKFAAKAYVSKKRKQKVITFRNIEKSYVSAYAYSCCWGNITNCYGTYIDCYTQKIT